MGMGMGLSMGLSDAEFRVTVLEAFSLSLALPLHSVCSFFWAFSEVPSRRSSSAMALLGLGPGS